MAINVKQEVDAFVTSIWEPIEALLKSAHAAIRAPNANHAIPPWWDTNANFQKVHVPAFESKFGNVYGPSFLPLDFSKNRELVYVKSVATDLATSVQGLADANADESKIVAFLFVEFGYFQTLMKLMNQLCSSANSASQTFFAKGKTCKGQQNEVVRAALYEKIKLPNGAYQDAHLGSAIQWR